ncbi:UbiA family prenyltransferase [Streptomyces celluloflavus]|uniref:UbiA family prenyltransferase n=1 Tax=Streptomyces celluloflavus TaxID=58344 RepID=UPI00367AD03F
MIQHYFGLFLAWLLLNRAALERPGTTPAMLLFLLGSAAIVACACACACAADDVADYRNGSDAINYQEGETLRDIRKKPQLSGAVTERQAIGFAISAGTAALLAGALAFWVLRWQAPAEAYVIYAAGFFFSVQYSVGMKVSYRRGGGETLLCLSTAAGLLAPFLAVNREWTRAAVIQSLLLGLWLVMVSSYSNMNDAEGDRSVGRKTLAVTAAPAVITAMQVALFLTSTSLLIWISLGDLPRWTLLTSLPTIALHGAQLFHGPHKKNWLRARNLGLIAYNFDFASWGSAENSAAARTSMYWPMISSARSSHQMSRTVAGASAMIRSE